MMAEKKVFDMMAPSSIPLKCLLCPKKPDFSDVSHLLTHIASKTHLSHRFKTEVKSDSDKNARETLQRYEEWYEQYGIRSLLAGRMAAKDHKKTLGKRNRSLGTTGPNKSNTPLLSNTLPDNLKAEPEDILDPSHDLGFWPDDQFGPDSPLPFHTARPEWKFDRSMCSTPVARGSREGSVNANALEPNHDRWPSASDSLNMDSVLQSEIVPEADEEDSNSSKLKGVKWPGMGLFDSANEDQKRKRNQRKDESILKRMEKTSSRVEPTEFVWTGLGELQLQRTRDIYDSPSIEGSPDRKFEEEKPVKKRARRSDAAPTTTQRRQTRQARPTRSSARIARIKEKAKVKSASEEEEESDEDEDDFIKQERDNRNQIGSHEAYDVFRDPHHRIAGRDTEVPNFELRRPALQPLSSNISMNSPTPKAMTQQHYGMSLRDLNKPAFASQSANGGASPYFHQPSRVANDSVNPLFIRAGGGFPPFVPFGFQEYGFEAKAPSPFPHPNTMNGSGLNNGLPYSSYNSPYPGHQINRANDYDI